MGYSFIPGAGGGGVVLGIPGRGVPHGSPNPDTISDQNMSFFPAIFRPSLYQLLLRLEHQRKRFFFFIIYLKLKQWISSYITVGSSKPIPDSRPKWAKTILVLRSKRHNKHTLWNGTYLYGLYMGVYPPPPGSFKNQSLSHFPIILFVSTTSFSIVLGHKIILGVISGRIAFANHVSGGKDKEERIMGNVEVGWEMDLQRVNGYIDCLSYGFKTSKTQTAHLLSISGLNFILFALKTSHCGIQLNRLCGVLKIIATSVLFYLLIWTL